MTERTRVIDAIKQPKPQELLRVADFIESMQDSPQTTVTERNYHPDYRAVRKALSALKTPLSDEVDRDRDNRV